MALKLWLPLNRDLKNVGLSNSIAINSGATLVNDGVFGKCYNLAIGKYIGIDAPNVNNHKYSPISIALWIYPTQNDSTSRTFFGCWENGGGGLTIQNSKFRFELYIGGGYKSCVAPSTVTINAWHHVCGTYDGKTMRLYVDGVEVKNLATTGNLTYHATCPWELGGNPGATAFGSGNIAAKFNDIRIYDHCLTDYDVKRLYYQRMFEIVPFEGITDVLFDRSGFMLMPLVNSNAVFQYNALYFNGTNAKLRPQNGNVGFTMDDGALSIWFSISTAPTGYQMLYIDSVSKFAIGFLNSGSFIVTCNNSAMPTFSASNIKYDGSINHIIASYNTGKTPQFCFINGIQAATATTNNWIETSGLTIGTRMYNTANSNFKGKIFKVDVFNRQFTQDEAVELYNSERGMFLPDDYIQLEYIQSTGTQWIDTGLKTTNEYFRVTTKIIASAYNSNMRPFGSQKNTQCTIVPWPKDSTNVYGWLAIGTDYYAQTTNSSFFNAGLNTEHYMDIIANSGHVTGNYCGYVLDSTYTGSLKNGYNNYIFASNRNGSPQVGGTQKIYWIKIYLNENQLSFNGIPAKRKSDNVIGMYDMVSGQFFTNSGTGSFTGG